MHKFNGYIINDGEIEKKSKFVCFGEMADGTKCFHEIDENGDEISGFWYSMSKIKVDGKQYALFFREGRE